MIKNAAWKKRIRFISLEQEEPFGWWVNYELVYRDFETDEFWARVSCRKHVTCFDNMLEAKLPDTINKITKDKLSGDQVVRVCEMLFANIVTSRYMG